MAASERTDRLAVGVGAVLLVGYLVVARLEVAWPALVRLQADDTYKVVSGLGLAGFLGWQWSLARRRHFDPIGAVSRHRICGAFAPVVLYLHAARFAYGYLLLLALVYLGTTAIGLLHRRVLRARVRWLFTTWFVVHVATSAVLVVLAGYHVVIALAYE